MKGTFTVIIIMGRMDSQLCNYRTAVFDVQYVQFLDGFFFGGGDEMYACVTMSRIHI